MMKNIGNIFRIKSLKWQILLRSFLILILLLIIMGTSHYIIMKNYLYNDKQQLLEDRVDKINKNTIEGLKSPQAVRKSANTLIKMIIGDNTSVSIIDENGNLLAEKSENVSEEIESAQEGSEIKKNWITPHLSPVEYKIILVQNKNLDVYRVIKDKNNNAAIVIFQKIGNPYSPSGLIQISTSIQSIQIMLQREIYIYIAASIFILIIGIVIGGIVLQHTLKPLFNMTNSLEQITIGQLNMRLPVDNGQNEIDRLSNAFNEMLKGIEISFEKEQYIKEKMQRFISDASHELRTPLTSIHGFVEILLRGAAKNEKQLDLALNTIFIETERLTKLVNDLLLLTKFDQQIPTEMLVENIKNIIEEIYPQLQIIAGERKVELQLKDNILVKANRNQIKQVVFNLVQNAIQHTDENQGKIIIKLNSIDQPSGVLSVLEVKDNGTGIPQKDLKEIFDRFFRSEAHRSRKQGGHGLGLSIVKSIIEAHRWEIHVESELGKGTVFTIFIGCVRIAK